MTFNMFALEPLFTKKNNSMRTGCSLFIVKATLFVEINNTLKYFKYHLNNVNTTKEIPFISTWKNKTVMTRTTSVMLQ